MMQRYEGNSGKAEAGKHHFPEGFVCAPADTDAANITLATRVENFLFII